ncbi:MAG: MgtC/SapB family protein [Candidatus Omnitrophica bacterium]|nr:MgtC/SapB family protein [Candidatus Omnitrophota bacterium]MCM8802995.1 MgtC/SapB family protein [Candidatus Omnitrophota bacterium]
MNEFEFIKKVLISGFLSGIIGFEREKHGREAGLRTMILVGMGTTTILISSFRVYHIFSNFQNPILRIDPARIAYGVVTGMGFLGAGVIIKDKKRIRGLTTAACLWFVTSIGLAVGVDLYIFSFFLTFIALVILYFLKIFEKKIPIDRYNIIKVIGKDKQELKDYIEKIIEEYNFKIISYEIERDRVEGKFGLTYTVRYKSPQNINELFEKISEIEGLEKIELK